MKKLAAFLLIFVFAVQISALATFEEETIAAVTDIDVDVPSAILMERSSGEVIYEKNAHDRMPIASVTKIMTLLLVSEAIESGSISLDTVVTASTNASSMGGSQIYLKEGEQMTVHEMLKSVVVSSANDAAVALAELVAGTESSFVGKMNEKAQELGMADTVFSNCTGLPCEGEHLSSAYDVALMSRALLSHGFIKDYTTIWMDSVRNGEFGLSNTNKLVRYYEGTTGLKTGFTQDAMYCLSASAERDGVEYIAVILHAENSDVRFENAKTLLNYAFANYCLVKAVPDEAIPPVAVKLGNCEVVQPVLSEEKSFLFRKNEVQGITKMIELCESAEAPIKEGEVLGKLKICDAAGSELESIDLIAGNEVKKLTIWQIFVKYLLILLARDL